MNDADREQWVMNDEGLYRWWRKSRMSMRTFVRTNRGDIDDVAKVGCSRRDDAPDYRTAQQYHQDKAARERWLRTHGDFAPNLK